MKKGFAVENILLEDFLANAAIFQMQLLAYNLVQYFKYSNLFRVGIFENLSKIYDNSFLSEYLGKTIASKIKISVPDFHAFSGRPAFKHVFWRKSCLDQRFSTGT